MFHIGIYIWSVFASWKWGDWRRLHQKNPLLAYLISVVITTYLLWQFQVPLRDEQ